MRWSFAFGLPFVLLAAPHARAADNLESVKKEWIAAAKEVVEALRNITDEPSAKAGRPQLKKLKAKIDEIKAREAKLLLGNFGQVNDVEKKFAKEVQAVTDAWARETARVQKVKGGPDALKELQ
jgi:hypothetical protein